MIDVNNEPASTRAPGGALYGSRPPADLFATAEYPMHSLNMTAIGTANDGAAAGYFRGKETFLEQRSAMQRFLADVERRAFSIARLAVRDTDDALDIVQEAMLKLVRSYSSAAVDEWRLLFFRILQNCIRDHQRRQTTRHRIFPFFRTTDDDDPEKDPILQAPVAPDEQPAQRLALSRAMEAFQTAFAGLPARQQEAFSLRALEGFDVAETARIMGCSQGSVKSHYSRAVHSLRAVLGEHWP